MFNRISRAKNFMSGRKPATIESPENILSKKEDALRERQSHLSDKERQIGIQESALKASEEQLKAAQDEFAKLATEEIAKNPLYQNAMFKQTIDKLKENIDAVGQIFEKIQSFTRHQNTLSNPTIMNLREFLDICQDAEETGTLITKIKNLSIEIDKIMNP